MLFRSYTNNYQKFFSSKMNPKNGVNRKELKPEGNILIKNEIIVEIPVELGGFERKSVDILLGKDLRKYGQISENNKNAVKDAVNKGTKVVIASGRGVMSVKNFANEIGANEYAVCGNGAVVYDFKQESIIYDKFLSQKKVLQLIKICEENSIYYSIYTQNSIIAKTLNYNVLFYHQENASKPDGKKTNICITEDIYQYVLNRKETDYTKITICDDNNIIFNSIIKKLREVKGIDVLDVGHMSRKLMKLGTEIHSIEYFYTEITNENANKWNALEFLIQKLGIEKEEVIAIGDKIGRASCRERV